MAVGISSANLATPWLNVLRNTAASAITPFGQLHTADPGAAGATGASTGATGRQSITWAAPSAGSMALSTSPSWSATGADTISHVSVWSASTAGNFVLSAALSASKTVANGDTFTLSTFTLAQSPIAA